MGRYINIQGDNIEEEHICCALAKGKHSKGAALKKNWLRQEFNHGLIFRKLDERGKVFIEIIPSEYALKPIIAPDFMVIHCLWVSGKFKGCNHGRTLLEFAINEAKKQGKKGICVLASKANYMTDHQFYSHFDFEETDQTDNGIFKLMSLKFFQNIPAPKIAAKAKKSLLQNGKDITVFITDQCPFVLTCLESLKTVALEYDLEVSVIYLKTHEEICSSPSPFGTYGIFLNETLLTHEMLSEGGYRKKLSAFLSL